MAFERPFDVSLRGFYDAAREGGTTYVSLDSDWRHTKGTTLITSDGHLDIETWEGVHVLANVRDVVVNSKNTRQFGGAVAPFNDNNLSGSAGLGYDWDSATFTAEALYGSSGWGARLGMNYAADDVRLGARAAWHEPYTETAEAVALRGERDYSALFAGGQVWDSLWATGEMKATRYGIRGDDNVATTLGWHGGLRFDFPRAGRSAWPMTATASMCCAPTPTSAGRRRRSCRCRSATAKCMHSVAASPTGGMTGSGSTSMAAGRSTAIPTMARMAGRPSASRRDRASTSSLDGHYATVPEMGEEGHELSGGVKLTIALNGDAPIMHGGAGL